MGWSWSALRNFILISDVSPLWAVNVYMWSRSHILPEDLKCSAGQWMLPELNKNLLPGRIQGSSHRDCLFLFYSKA